GGWRPVIGVWGFRKQFDRALALVDRFLFLAQGRKDQAELPVSGRLLRGFTHEPFRDDTSALERSPRLFLVTFIQIELPFQKSLRARSSCAVSQRLPAKLLHDLKSLRKFPLERQNPSASPCDQPTWIGFPRNLGEFIFGQAKIALPVNRHHSLYSTSLRRLPSSYNFAIENLVG